MDLYFDPTALIFSLRNDAGETLTPVSWARHTEIMLGKMAGRAVASNDAAT